MTLAEAVEHIGQPMLRIDAIEPDRIAQRLGERGTRVSAREAIVCSGEELQRLDPGGIAGLAPDIRRFGGDPELHLVELANMAQALGSDRIGLRLQHVVQLVPGMCHAGYGRNPAGRIPLRTPGGVPDESSTGDIA